MIKVCCAACGKEVIKKESQIGYSKSGLLFCSLKCSGSNPKRKTSWSESELAEAVIKCTSFREVCVLLDLSESCSSKLKSKALAAGIDFSHFRAGGFKRRDVSQLRSRRGIKRRLIDSGLVDERCSICGISEWMGQKIGFDLDHIDGDKRNNNPSNLRLLCPNCHSQTPTFRGRNKGKYSKVNEQPSVV